MKVIIDLVAQAWLALLVTSVWLLIRKRRRLGGALLGFTAFLSLVALVDLPSRLLAGLERPYLEGDDKSPADAVVVCGGGWFASDHSHIEVTLNESADRLLAAIEFARRHRAPELVLGGGGQGDPPRPVESTRAKEWIERWHLVDLPVNVLPASRDTHGEAVHTAELAQTRGWKKIVLITSAWHMRRTAAVFRKTGLTVIPVACDFRGTCALENRRKPGNPDRYLPFPRTQNVQNMNIWLQESIGYLYYKLRGWI